MGSKPMTVVLIKWDIWTWRQILIQKGGCVNTKADSRALWLQATECQRRRGPRGAWWDARGRLSLTAAQDTNPADILILDSSLQGSERVNLCCLSHPGNYYKYQKGFRP